jgi:hypothetical protein
MPLTQYEIANGYNQSTRSNIEDLIRSAYLRPFAFSLSSQPVPDGNAAIVTADKATHWDGDPIITWNLSVIPYAGFEALINKALGSFNVDSAQVSIKTRNQQNGYSTYNANLAKPQPEVNYRVRYRSDGSFITNLQLTFRIVGGF